MEYMEDRNFRVLEQEVAELKLALKAKQRENRCLKLWRDHISGSAITTENPEVAAAMLESLQYQKDTLEKITGVNITTTKTEVADHEEKAKMVWDSGIGRWRRGTVGATNELGEMSVMRRQVIEGSCGETEFQLQLDVQENMDTDSNITCHIQEMSIFATENITTDLEDDIQRLVSDRNAQGFLSLLNSYEMWRSARQKTFQHFITKYPDIAKTPNGRTIHFKHPTKKLVFVIDWDLMVTDVYRIVPDIQLNIQLPKKVRPQTDVLDVAPEKFKVMLKELGIEKTLNTLIALLLK